MIVNNCQILLVVYQSQENKIARLRISFVVIDLDRALCYQSRFMIKPSVGTVDLLEKNTDNIGRTRFISALCARAGLLFFRWKRR